MFPACAALFRFLRIDRSDHIRPSSTDRRPLRFAAGFPEDSIGVLRGQKDAHKLDPPLWPAWLASEIGEDRP
jgi:hypothetical protein